MHGQVGEDRMRIRRDNADEYLRPGRVGQAGEKLGSVSVICEVEGQANVECGVWQKLLAL
jgi:hypothetical protein